MQSFNETKMASILEQTIFIKDSVTYSGSGTLKSRGNKYKVYIDFMNSEKIKIVVNNAVIGFYTGPGVEAFRQNMIGQKIDKSLCTEFLEALGTQIDTPAAV